MKNNKIKPKKKIGMRKRRKRKNIFIKCPNAVFMQKEMSAYELLCI